MEMTRYFFFILLDMSRDVSDTVFSVFVACAPDVSDTDTSHQCVYTFRA